MSDAPKLPLEQADLLAQIAVLLADPAEQDNAMREPLQQLLQHCQQQHQRLERLVKISDGYHSMSRTQTLTLEKLYDRQLRRVEKLMRISDGYQNSLREASEALRHAALQDPLTGLGNRRYLMEQLAELPRPGAQRPADYSLGILDVDFFKSINDRFGHDIGDLALIAIARTIRAALPAHGLCGRWGGEEFLLIMPETPLDSAKRISAAMLDGIRSLELESCTEKITASVGLTVLRSDEAFSDTLRRADAALRQAKRNGRDQIATLTDGS
jgi:diguanylate cyclase (GGDEF)-like protein